MYGDITLSTGHLYLLLDDEIFTDLVSYDLSNGDLLVIADFSRRQFVSSASVSIKLLFNNPTKTYWGRFISDNSEINLINNESILFCGFSWSERDGRVNEIKLNNHKCCADRATQTFNNNVFTINIHEATDRLSRVQTNNAGDEVDGSSSCSNMHLFESGRKSKETYAKNTKFEKGRLVQRVYLVFYNGGGMNRLF
jgi:hypothetical protein